MINNIEVFLNTFNVKIAIIIARFNNFINNNLLNGTINTLKRIGKINEQKITTIWVPGTNEISLIAKILTKKNYNAIITLGTIIKGKTIHYKYIYRECIKNLSLISIKNCIPIITGIIIAKNIEQAIERAGTKNGNIGSNAALVTLEMINLIKILK